MFRDASGYLVYDDSKGTAYPSYAERHLAKDWIIPSSSDTDDESVKTDYVRSSETGPDDLEFRQSPNETDSNVHNFQSWGDFSSGEDIENRPLLLTVTAPGVFERAITLVLSHVSEFLSPGFVIQRVQGNVSWLEEVQEPGVDCYYSGIVLEHPDESNVAISLCDGVVSTALLSFSSRASFQLVSLPTHMSFNSRASFQLVSLPTRMSFNSRTTFNLVS